MTTKISPIPGMIREICLKEHLSRKDLAEKIRVSPLTIKRWEMGENTPRKKVLDQLCLLHNLAGEGVLKKAEPLFNMGQETKMPNAPGRLVSVTKETIKTSTQRDSSHCMIADSIRETFPGCRYVSVDVQTIRFSDPKEGFRYTYLTPRVCQHAIVRFDQGQLPEPFSFKLQDGQVTACSGKGSYYSRHKKKVLARLKKARLHRRNKGADDTTNKVMERIGGRTPPRISTRREFGLRAYAR